MNYRIALMAVLMAMAASGDAEPGQMSPSFLMKRLGFNRAIGDGRPQISSVKKKGQSTVYFIKLPPQPHYYIPTNYFPTSHGSKDAAPFPFEKVSVDFTANGKPESVYHWNLPLGFTVASTTTTTTTTRPTTSVTTDSTPRTKKPFKKNFYNNGKPSKVYFVKPAQKKLAKN